MSKVFRYITWNGSSQIHGVGESLRSEKDSEEITLLLPELLGYKTKCNRVVLLNSAGLSLYENQQLSWVACSICGGGD